MNSKSKNYLFKCIILIFLVTIFLSITNSLTSYAKPPAKHRSVLKKTSKINTTSQIDDKSKYLLEYVNTNNLNECNNLLNQGANINFKSKYGQTALIIAVKNGYTDLTDFLIKCGANVDIQDNRGMTALMWAARFNHTNLITSLLQKGADITIRDNYKKTALMWATRLGRKNAVQLLLNHINNINPQNPSAVHNYVNAQNKYSKTAFTYADINGHPNICNLLKFYGATK